MQLRGYNPPVGLPEIRVNAYGAGTSKQVDQNEWVDCSDPHDGHGFTATCHRGYDTSEKEMHVYINTLVKGCYKDSNNPACMDNADITNFCEHGHL